MTFPKRIAGPVTATVGAAVQFNTVYPTPCTTVPSFAVAPASDKRYSLGVMGITSSLFNPTNAAAAWSAVAASFSAIAACLSWRAQVRGLRQAHRPEIVLSDWHRIQAVNPDRDLVTFNCVSNAGRDTAVPVLINASQGRTAVAPLYAMSTIRLPYLVAGASTRVSGEIMLFWENARIPSGGHKGMHVEIRAMYVDPLGVHHTTTTSLFVTEDVDAPHAGTSRIASGIYFSSHITRSMPSWRRQVTQSLRRWPILGRLIRNDA